MTERTKDDVIKSVYNAQDGFGSIESTYKKAKMKDKTITKQNVKDWFFNNVEQTAKVKGYNTYIPNAPLDEFQIDHLTFGRGEENEGLAIIDTFTKLARVYPGKNDGAHTLAALMEAINRMGKPKMIFCDNASTFNLVKDFCKDNKIQFIITTGHAMVVERFIRTFKSMIWKRLKANKLDSTKWEQFLNDVIFTYNSTVHTATGMKPYDAIKPENTLNIKVNLEMKRHDTRKYPEIKVGDKVKLFYKKPLQAKKEELTNWGDTVYEVTSISESFNQKYYHLKDFDRAVLRHDMLKVA